ncbi:MAG: hypothetical protein ABSH01_01945 [Terriglobia bacterium]|jgi:hypothetical protein
MSTQLKAGAAKCDITPAVGAYLCGFIARLEPSNAVAEPLHVRTLVLSSGTKNVALVQADVVAFAPWQVAETREFAYTRLGIPRDAVMLSATHTHSGPGLIPVRGCRMAPYAYQREVIEKIQVALGQARESLRPATLEIGSVPYLLGINRRQETSNGVVLGFAPEKARPQNLKMARVRTKKQEILLLSYACHPYILGGDSLWISGDFPSLACLDLEHEFDRLVFFLNGCAGNIAPRSAFQGIEKARDEGLQLSKIVQAGAKRLRRTQGTLLAARSRLVHLPYQPLPTDDEIDALAAQEERVVRPEEKGSMEIRRRIDAALEQWRTEMKQVVQMTRPLDPVLCEIQALRIGPLVLLGISGEPFFEIGEALRQSKKSSSLWPLGNTNAYCGYIPTRAEYPNGGYGVNDSWKYAGMWKIDETCEERVTKAGIEVLAEVLAGR